MLGMFVSGYGRTQEFDELKRSSRGSQDKSTFSFLIALPTLKPMYNFETVVFNMATGNGRKSLQKDPLAKCCVILITMQLVNLCSHRMVVLDPSLTKILVNKNEDLQLLPWDQLFERFALGFICADLSPFLPRK